MSTSTVKRRAAKKAKKKKTATKKKATTAKKKAGKKKGVKSSAKKKAVAKKKTRKKAAAKSGAKAGAGKTGSAAKKTARPSVDNQPSLLPSDLELSWPISMSDPYEMLLTPPSEDGREPRSGRVPADVAIAHAMSPIARVPGALARLWRRLLHAVGASPETK